MNIFAYCPDKRPQTMVLIGLKKEKNSNGKHKQMKPYKSFESKQLECSP